MAKVLVLFYSSWGHIETMANAVAEGARSAGASVTVKRVPELVPAEVAKQFHFKEQTAPVADPNELADYDAIIIGTPTRFGNMAAQMKNFLDQTGGLWAQGKLVGKVGGVFTSTATQHGGQESTLLTMLVPLLHHGCVIAGIPFTEPALSTTRGGGTPYGASHVAGAQDAPEPTDEEAQLARALGRRIALLASKLHA